MKRLILMALFTAVAASGCVATDEADEAQSRDTRQALAEAHKQVGMPDITKWTERKLARDILELRDKEITTYCYIVNLNGELIFLGEAIGFGLPYSVQFTNPIKHHYVRGQMASGDRSGAAHMVHSPQADPNGLFMPEGLSATWIMLKDPESGKIHPVYIEPEIVVSPFKLHATKAD